MRFKVQANEEGEVPVEWAAVLLAMHCVIRGQEPTDYQMFIIPTTGMPEPISQRASDLLKASRGSVGTPVHITRREGEVLAAIFKHKSNKEIGNELNLSERTIKFHVSSLLAKFGSRDRIDLMCKAAVGVLPPDMAKLPEALFGMPLRPTNPEPETKPAEK